MHAFIGRRGVRIRKPVLLNVYVHYGSCYIYNKPKTVRFRNSLCQKLREPLIILMKYKTIDILRKLIAFENLFLRFSQNEELNL